MNILFIINVMTVNFLIFLIQVLPVMFTIEPTIDHLLLLFLWKQIDYHCKETQYNQDIGPRTPDRAVLEGD